MNKSLKIFLIVLSYMLVYIAGSLEHKHTASEHTAIVTDTTYNHIELDSITYKITIKDSIVYHLKIQSNEAIEKSYSISDSDAVVLFKQLTSE